MHNNRKTEHTTPSTRKIQNNRTIGQIVSKTKTHLVSAEERHYKEKVARVGGGDSETEQGWGVETARQSL